MSEKDTSQRSGESSPGLSDVDFLLTPPRDPSWLIVEDGFTLVREHEIESIFAVANGYIGARAAVEEGSRLSQPGVFAAGVYIDDPNSLVGPALATLPDWSRLEIIVDGQRLSLESGRVLEHRRILDLRRGILWREWRQQDLCGRITRAVLLRLVSLSDRHALLQSAAVTAENYSGQIELVADAASFDRGNKRGRLTADSEATIITVLAGKTVVAMAAGAISRPNCELPRSFRKGSSVDRPEKHWSWEARLGETVHLHRPVAIYTSREAADPGVSAQRHVAYLQEQGMTALIAAHSAAWSRRWSAADLRIVGDSKADLALRFAAYHLIAAANPADEHVSIGARGLTGRAYQGHVFWDTEIYMLPFYLLTEPTAARALLMYRYHTLGAARRKAEAYGYRGALYAWESTDTGAEATPRAALAPDGRIVPILTGAQEHHISADIAYAVWQYWRATGDDGFMIDAGGDILIETARFWASRARMEPDGRAHIRAVIGPDEYHETVDDNAYTNIMARWNLDRAADAATRLARKRPAEWRRQAARLALDDDEPMTWRRIAAALVTGFHPATGLFEQFEGYFALDDVDVVSRREGSTPLDLYLGREKTRRSKAIKQADVVAICALLWDEWPRAVHAANFAYYEPRTAHGSSLSPAIHALVAARLDDGERALKYFRQSSEIDLADNMGNAAGGVHMGALAGLWQAAVFGMAGLRIREDGIALDPHLPPGWSEICFPALWRGRTARLTLEADPARIEVEVEGVGEMTIRVIDGPSCRARAGRCYVSSRQGARWGAWREACR
ncbi:glycoside hydrolase family 65 protein [Methylosinus sp. KRF6]|uniref:glycoside hydrolase family 65 protein n=1 Tax=Methylosinus sp. KRF6 TaxID=2846853 RepID=UPI001C0DEA38|nr:glycosyl hydrolase family 65 protein [Methylosinus sp. KRF6]MBU3887866.1 glycoside hydrolase family 65 protein [Methylosinus sp. KRF6]